MKNLIKKLTPTEIKTLKRLFKSLTFANEFDLVYESQIPNTGIVLLDGELALFRKKKMKSKVEPGSMLGVFELVNNEPVDLGLKILGNTELIMIQKSDIMDALSDKDSELYAIIKETI